MSTKKMATKKNAKFTIKNLNEQDSFILNTTTDETLAKYPAMTVKQTNQRRAYLRMKLKVSATNSPARWLNGKVDMFPADWTPDNSNQQNSGNANQNAATKTTTAVPVTGKALTLSVSNAVVNYKGQSLFVNGVLTMPDVSKVTIEGNIVTVE